MGFTWFHSALYLMALLGVPTAKPCSELSTARTSVTLNLARPPTLSGRHATLVLGVHEHKLKRHPAIKKNTVRVCLF